MELVIKLDDETYKKAINRTEFDTLSLGIKVIEAVQNGIPLLKGHGRLIDADELKTAFPCGEYVRTECVRATIDYAQTIIEADKEK